MTWTTGELDGTRTKTISTADPYAMLDQKPWKCPERLGESLVVTECSLSGMFDNITSGERPEQNH